MYEKNIIHFIFSIPNSVETIGIGSFASCSNLESISIPSSVTSIGQSAFVYCDKLKSIKYDGTQSRWSEIYKDSLQEGVQWNFLNRNKN